MTQGGGYALANLRSMKKGLTQICLGRQSLIRDGLQLCREIGYHGIRLDTLPSMKEAITLYQSLGFRLISPYYPTPGHTAMFMELDLML